MNFIKLNFAFSYCCFLFYVDFLRALSVLFYYEVAGVMCIIAKVNPPLPALSDNPAVHVQLWTEILQTATNQNIESLLTAPATA